MVLLPYARMKMRSGKEPEGVQMRKVNGFELGEG